MNTTNKTDSAITELSLLVAKIDEAIAGSFDNTESLSASEANSGGAWKYQFQTNSAWGFVAGGPDERAETSYPGWGIITVEPGHCAVFYDDDFAGIISPDGGRIGGYAVGERDWDVADLEDAMVGAFRAEYDALTSGSERTERDQSGVVH
jgi:hypothetical protein